MYSLNPIYHPDYDRSQHQPRSGSIESHRRPRTSEPEPPRIHRIVINPSIYKAHNTFYAEATGPYARYKRSPPPEPAGFVRTWYLTDENLCRWIFVEDEASIRRRDLEERYRLTIQLELAQLEREKQVRKWGFEFRSLFYDQRTSPQHNVQPTHTGTSKRLVDQQPFELATPSKGTGNSMPHTVTSSPSPKLISSPVYRPRSLWLHKRLLLPRAYPRSPHTTTCCTSLERKIRN